jgi:hypothetical protein
MGFFDKPRLSPLEFTRQLAQVLDGAEYGDGLSQVQKRALRESADTLVTGLAELGLEPTIPTLMAIWTGAALQATRTAPTDVLGQLLKMRSKEVSGPAPELMLVLAHLARDVLAGERVE